MTNKKFSAIVADCPWPFKDTLKMSDVPRGAAANYDTMTISDIQSLPVKMACHPDGAVLCLWVPSSLLAEGLETMKAWGFNYKQTWIWVKIKNDPFAKLKKQKKIDWDKVDWNDFLSFGMGHLGRNVHEIVLVGTRGKIGKKLKNRSQRTVFFYKNTKHSKKPELLQDKLELMFPNQNYLEIFGRRMRPNWTIIGNESPETLNEDIFDSLDNLLK
jgi:N6-adenosine-specific RNA methylase IME4